jgi:hypothetical protein
MDPIIRPCDVLHVAPIHAEELSVGDIALYQAGSRILAHRVVRIRAFFPQARQCRSSMRSVRLLKRSASGASPSGEPALLITLQGDACTTPDPPVTADQILGKLIGVERQGRHLDPYHPSFTRYSHVYRFLSRLIRFFRF